MNHYIGPYSIHGLLVCPEVYIDLCGNRLFAFGLLWLALACFTLKQSSDRNAAIHSVVVRVIGILHMNNTMGCAKCVTIVNMVY